MSTDEQLSERYVGAIIGESTSTEFRLAVASEAVHEQDIIALDAELRESNQSNDKKQVRVWAKVQRIERLNPLFPIEAGHELAHTHTDPLDTVLSLTREMVTAVCQVLGWEPKENSNGKLSQLRYPPRPASNTYTPNSADIIRVVVGDHKEGTALDIATLANRSDVDIKVDGGSIVTRHLAILAMTGAGKSWTSRRIIEELAEKNYPMVIFDPHGDYTGLGNVSKLENKVIRYYAEFPIFDESSETVAEIVNNLSDGKLTDLGKEFFDVVFGVAKPFLNGVRQEYEERKAWLTNYVSTNFEINPNLWLIAHLVDAAMISVTRNDEPAKQMLRNYGWRQIADYNGTDVRTLKAILWRVRKAAAELQRMEQMSKNAAGNAQPLPVDRTQIVRYGQISIIALSGYSGDFQATICSLIAKDIFSARVSKKLNLPVLFILEEAHNFVPARADTSAEKRCVEVIRQIAQEGRKYRVGLVIISQRPSRLDETTLSMCNSFIIMRMVNPADQNFVRKVMETVGEDDVRLLPDLDKGEALLSGQMISFPVLAKIKEPKSRGDREEDRDAFTELEEDNRKLQEEARKPGTYKS